MTRTALVKKASAEKVARYLPDNYAAIQVGDDVLVTGTDNLGWTLEDYVIPRLASGMYFATETTEEPS